MGRSHYTVLKPPKPVVPGTLEAGSVEDPTPDVQPLQNEHRLGADPTGVRTAPNSRHLPASGPLRQVGVGAGGLGHGAHPPHPVLNTLPVECLEKRKILATTVICVKNRYIGRR